MEKYILVIPALLLILSCNQQKTDTKSEGEKVMQTSRDWCKIASTGDIEKTLRYWTDSAILMAGGQPVVRGKKEIRRIVEENFKTPGFKINWEPQSVEVSQSGDMAYLIEKQTISLNDSAGKAITFHSNALTVWRKQTDGSWKNAVDFATPE
jgi:ketosteroid isomerase-like protein